MAELLLELDPDAHAAAIEHLDSPSGSSEMKMQPSLERALRNRGLLKAWSYCQLIVLDVWSCPPTHAHLVVLGCRSSLFPCGSVWLPSPRQSEAALIPALARERILVFG